MPEPSKPLRKLGFLTIGLFDGDDPRPGHESTLEIIELGEQLGFDSAWVRHRHLQYGISSPVAVLAAASQRTSRIELGTAVIPLGWENPLRLAEDLATVDLLSGGRLNPGRQRRPADALRPRSRTRSTRTPPTSRTSATSGCERLLDFVRGEPATDFSGIEGIEVFSDRVQPHSPGLAGRMWYGGASLRSAQWAGEHGMNLLTSSVVKAEESEDFAEIQLSHIRDLPRPPPRRRPAPGSRRGWSSSPPTPPRPSSARSTRQYAERGRPAPPRRRGRRGMMFAPDLVGTSDEIAERLYAHAAFREIDEVAFALPFTFEHEDYVQILTDIATKLGPALGWRPAS